jgi:hypothetical protein
VNKTNIQGHFDPRAHYKYSPLVQQLARNSSSSSEAPLPVPASFPAMGPRRSGGGGLRGRLLVLSSLLLLASGEVFFEERFEGIAASSPAPQTAS